MENNKKRLAKLRPTVIIGLGGTGHDILLILKKKLIDTFGALPPRLAFLSIDVAEPENYEIKLRNGNLVSLDPTTERLTLQVPNATNIIGDINPHITEWWPEDTFVSTITSGARQIRALGRLAFFAKYTEILSRMNEAIDKVNNIRTINEMDNFDLRGSERQGIDIYIISSVAGGTGSGMMLDVAFNLRQLIDPASNITGVLVLPRIFNKDPGIRQKPNSYAALKEIEFFMKIRKGDAYTINYSGDNHLTINRPPFDLLYIADAINEHRRVVKDKQLLFSVIAEGVFSQIGSQIGTKKDNSLNNIKTQLSAIEQVRWRSANYCSFGIAALRLDLEQYEKHCENAKSSAAISILDEMLNGNAVQSVPTHKALNAIYGQAELGNIADLIVETLTKSGMGEPLSFKFNIAGLPEARRNRIHQLRARYDNGKRKMEAEVATATLANHEKLSEDMGHKVEVWWEGLANQLGGLNYTATFVERVISEIKAHLEYLVNQNKVDGKGLADIQNSISELREHMNHACGFFQYYFGGG